MKTLTRILLCAMLLATAFAARAERIFNQAELDALLAPVALYPDNVLSDILVGASYPEDVREAAAWSRANAHLRGDDALRAVDATPWHPSVKALAAFPEVLARMDESPAWLNDLGEAYRVHGPYVMDTVQSLRQRARASGHLQSDPYQQVYDDAGAIAIAPAYPQYYYVRYYDPYVVYGPWWYPAYRPVVWRPWPVYATFVSVGFVAARPDWHRRVVVVNRPVYVNRPVVQKPVVVHRPVERPTYAQRHVVQRPPVVHGPVVVQRPLVRTQVGAAPERPRDNGGPSPAAREQQKYARDREKERARQQGSQRHDIDRSRDHDRRPGSRPSRSEPKGKVGYDRGRSDNGQHRGRRD